MRELRGAKCEKKRRASPRRVFSRVKRCPPPPFEKKKKKRDLDLDPLHLAHLKKNNNQINKNSHRLSDDGTPLTHAELLSLLEQQGVAPGGRKREAQPFQAKVRSF